MITELKSFKSASLGIIAVATLLLIAGAVWWGAHKQPAEVNQPPIVASAPTEATPAVVVAESQPTPPVVEAHASLADTSTIQRNPLTPEEVDRLLNWYRERGGTDDGRMLADGSIVGGDAFSGYRTTDDAGLAMFVKQGDPYAAEMLGTRLAERYRETHQSDDLKEAKRLLLDATTRGFTTSLTKLYELQMDVAENRGVEVRRGAPRIDRQALLEAYQYLYLLERRGDLSIDAHKTTAKAIAQNIGNLNADEDALARKRANDLYQSMAEQRQQLGLPPFVDGVPADIQDMVDRAMAGGK